MVIIIMHYALIIMNYYLGGLAQLARAPALHAGGQRFESVILHTILKKADQATAWSAFSFLFALAPIKYLGLVLDFLHKGIFL